MANGKTLEVQSQGHAPKFDEFAKENIMNLGEAIIGGIIGAVFGLLVVGVVFSWLQAPLILINLYVALGLAGFFGSFFGILFSSKCSKKN